MPNVTQPTAVIKFEVAAPLLPPTDTMLYRQGFDAFCAGATLEAQATYGERRGWLGALDAQAEASTPGYAQSMGF